MFRYAASNKSMSVDMSTVSQEDSMSRVQLALNVADVDAAVEFYSRLFGVAPAKRRPGYANFAIEEPALKLVLIENAAAPGTLNHLGVEVSSPGEVAAAQTRLEGVGLATATEENVSCCYAVQDKVWVSDPDSAPWEIYTVLADANTMGCGPAAEATDGAGDVCCAGTTA
jgi:catechol 2,3-dioxygenase-like lactoylglutathione lyase family enzyme